MGVSSISSPFYSKTFERNLFTVVLEYVFSTNVEEESSVLSSAAMEQRDNVPPAQGELAGEGREVSEEASGESSRSGLRNASSSDEYGDGNDSDSDSEGSGDDGSDSDEDADYEVSQEEARSVCSEWLCAQPIGVARMMAVIMMDTLKSELRLAHLKAAEISGSVVGCSERSVRQCMLMSLVERMLQWKAVGRGRETMSPVMKRFQRNWCTG